MAKVFYGNQYVGSIKVDGKKSKETIMNRIKKYFKNLFMKVYCFVKKVLIVGSIAAFIIGTYYGMFKMGEATTRAEISYAAPVEIDKSSEIFKQKIEKMKMEVVETVRKCEQAHYKESDGVIIFDPLVSDPSKTSKKDVPSIGTLQFKQSTVIHYYKTLYGKTINGKEAALIAFDDAKAGQLAKDIMFTTSKKANDWLNCANKHDINKKIDIIKNLEN